MTLATKPKLTEDEVEFIAFIQERIIEIFRTAKGNLSEEEIAYCLKSVFSQEELKFIIENLWSR